MKHFKFIMDCGKVYDVIAKSFKDACEQFDAFGEDARRILAMEEVKITLHQGLTVWTTECIVCI